MSTFWHVNSIEDYAVIKKVIMKTMQINGVKYSYNEINWRKQETMLRAQSDN